MAPVIYNLDSGWVFKETEGKYVGEWLTVAQVPTNVHLDLLNHNVIPDPFLGFNELKCQWVAETSWTYKIALPSVAKRPPTGAVVLAFDGLDTFATVKLNGSTILTTDNMFLPHRVDVTNLIDYGEENTLEILFESAFTKAREIKDSHPEHTWVGFNGDPARLAVRKAQYHWGWDWGPVLCPCGPWKPVRLEIYTVRLSDLRVDYNLDANFKRAFGTLIAVTEGQASNVRFEIWKDDNAVFTKAATVGPDGIARVDFNIDDPELWYPHGYGSQPLYELRATVLSRTSSQDANTSSRWVGLRKAELIQEPDEIGKSFYFRVNGIDIFCGGSDWIPADSFTPRITAERYRKWLQMMVDGHQVMIRVWGGGIYEDDIFYNLCDKLGVLVWQDFMFGCGNYPAFSDLLKSIEAEAISNVRRLRHHPSIVIFAGNNEDYQVQEEFGLTYDYHDKDPENWLRSTFPARYIYEKLLPEVVRTEAPQIPYHPGSPWGDGLKTSNTTVGDMHQWNVWHGTQEKYQIFDTLGGRFNSEFGMEAFPHIDTIRSYCTDETQLFPQSHMIDFHNKADGHERRIATYLVENFRTVTDLEGFIHLTQLSQAEALMFGYRGWRKQWGQKRFCGGALVWQLNDCWPVTSWSIVDYYQRKKPAYYAMRRVLAPVAVAIKRAHWNWSVVHARPLKRVGWECWIASKEPTAVVRARVEVRFVSVATGKDIKEKLVEEVDIVPNGTTDAMTGVICNWSEEPHVLAVRLWIDGHLVARDCDWPQPLKYLDFRNRGIQVKMEGTTKLRVSAARPTKGLVFEERMGILLDDSALDIVPGDEQVVTVKGLKENDAPLKWRYLGME